MEAAALVEAVQSIAQRAGEAILEVYYAETPLQVIAKADDSPVTQADWQSNNLITEALQALTPGIPILSEETPHDDYSVRRQYEYWWLIDPLDGTKEFIRRNGEFCVCIALMYREFPVLGVIYVPVLEEMYWAVSGKGSYLSTGGTIYPLHVFAFKPTDPALKVACSRSHLDPATQAFVANLNHAVLQPVGSARKMGLLARGDIHLYPRLATLHEWDLAAGQLIVEEAGGRIIDYKTGQRIAYNTPSLYCPPFIAMGQTDPTFFTAKPE